MKNLFKSAITFAGMTAITAGAALMSGCSGSGSSTSTKTDSTASTTTSASTTAAPTDENTLLGAGSTFVYPLFSKLFNEYNTKNGLKINYQSIGSGGGILQLTNKTVDFGASDAPLNDEQQKKIGVPTLHIPMAAGADVISYNLPMVKDTLKLTSDVLADIFLGKIKNWNDPAIKALNPKAGLPDLNILVVHRTDGSGTSFIFTDYLTKVNDEWAKKAGKGTAINWPAGIGGKGNEGVAGLLKQTPGAIAYVELTYAIQNKMPGAYIKNKAGKWVFPTLESITAAGNVKLPDDAKVSITNTDAADGYPLSSFTWVIIYKDQQYNNRSADRASKLLNLLWWNIHDGQQFCKGLNYAPLPQNALTVAENNLKAATYGGQPILKK